MQHSGIKRTDVMKIRMNACAALDYMRNSICIILYILYYVH